MPALPQFKKLQTNDYNLNMVQTNIASTVSSIIIQPLVTGTLLPSVALIVGDNTIFHNLGAPLQGWLTTRVRDAATALFDKQETNPTPAKTLILNSTVAVTVDLVVF